MSAQRSLQVRLVARLVAIFAVGAVAATGGAVIHAVLTLDSLADRSLVAQARDVERAVVVGGDGAIAVRLPKDLVAAYAIGGSMFAVFDAAGRAVAAAPAGAGGRFAQAVGAPPALGFFTLSDKGEARPVLAYVADAGHILPGLRIAVAQSALHDDSFYDSVVEEFLEGVAWWIVPVVLAVIAVAVLTIRATVRSLDEVSRAAAAIGPEQPRRRLPTATVPREIAPLVSAVNSALDRLAEAFERQRCFTADAAHGLRTPLAVLAARVESLADHPEGAALAADVARMTRLVDQLLHVARLEAAPLDRHATVDLHAVAVKAASAVAPLAVKKGCALALEEAGGRWTVHGNEAAIGLALLNLLENAIEHSPPGGRVVVRLEGTGVVSVADHGPGIPAAAREAVFQRFWRGGNAGGRGAGLGLAIVAEVMNAHGGRATVAEAEGGGAVFSLVFPEPEPLAEAPAGGATPSLGRRAAAGA